MVELIQDLDNLDFIEINKNSYLSPFRYNSAHLSFWLDKIIKDKTAEEEIDKSIYQKIKSFEYDYISNFKKKNYKVTDSTLYFLGE